MPVVKYLKLTKFKTTYKPFTVQCAKYEPNKIFEYENNLFNIKAS